MILFGFFFEFGKAVALLLICYWEMGSNGSDIAPMIVLVTGKLKVFQGMMLAICFIYLK